MANEHEADLRHSTERDAASYLHGRWKEQCAYFDGKAAACQKKFIRLRRVSLLAGTLTPIAIFVITLVVVAAEPTSHWVHLWHLLPITLSAVALGAYQWEELHNYGAQWSKFRMVAERLKGNRELFLQRAGNYGRTADGKPLSDEEAGKRFVEYCEGLIEGNDINYFVLMVDPLRREIA